MNSNTAHIPAGRAYIGTKKPVITKDGEGPVRRQQLTEFWIDTCAVTNKRFSEFVESTGYITEAEEIGWSFAFNAHIPNPPADAQRVNAAQWWLKTDEANWRAISGRGSESQWHADHPVVQISKRDAETFAAWAGGRLPTEAEWEHAARGGQGDVRFPWGNEEPDDEHFQPCNIWQGNFPYNNLELDGYNASAPAKSYEANPYGLYNMCGNVWEWTASPFKLRSLSASARKREKLSPDFFVLKGGSYLCHKSYCFRYRIAARTSTSADSATSHQGFRLVYDQMPKD